MRPMEGSIRCSLVVSILSLVPTVTALAVEPGVDIAAPRVAISQVANATTFNPAQLTVEQGDYVRWQHVGTTLIHTTTSGAPDCLADGLWNATLGAGAQFTREFPEIPASYPFFCMPHCAFGMTGTVTVTEPIALMAAESGGSILLSWTGGGSLYRVIRSDVPSFTGPGTVGFVPTGGNAGTSFSDPTLPIPGAVLFYLTMNL